MRGVGESRGSPQRIASRLVGYLTVMVCAGVGALKLPANDPVAGQSSPPLTFLSLMLSSALLLPKPYSQPPLLSSPLLVTSASAPALPSYRHLTASPKTASWKAALSILYRKPVRFSFLASLGSSASTFSGHVLPASVNSTLSTVPPLHLPIVTPVMAPNCWPVSSLIGPSLRLPPSVSGHLMVKIPPLNEISPSDADSIAPAGESVASSAEAGTAMDRAARSAPAKARSDLRNMDTPIN